MIGRLGKMIGWTASAIGAVLFVGGALLAALSTQGPDRSSAAFVAGVGVTVFLIGRAIRHILAGPAPR